MAALRRLQQLVEKEPGVLAGIGGLVLAVALPTALRLALQPLLGGALWFATYYPALLCATLALGWRWGVAALLLSALAADYLFIPPPRSLSLETRDVAAVVVFLLSGGLLVLSTALLREALHRLNTAAETQKALNRELQHRVNNNLAVIQALAAQTMRSSPDLQTFYERFRGRVIAVSAANRILSAGDWATCEFPALPEAALRPFSSEDRVQIEGPPCSVPAESCVPLVLALHELGTNATKYGALSVPQGQVLLRWALRGAAKRDLVIEWLESGGPQVEQPTRTGLGSRLLAAQVGIADVQTEFRREGLLCTLLIEGAAADGPVPAAAGSPMVLAPSAP